MIQKIISFSILAQRLTKVTDLVRSFSFYVLNHKRAATVTSAIAILSLLSVSILTGTQSVFRSYPVGADLNVNGDFAFFKDPSTSIKLSSIDFGSITFGHNYRTVYAKNLGNMNITLVFNIFSENSSVSSVELSENYSGAIISAGKIIPILFDMFVLPNATNGVYPFIVNVSSQ
jgi:hypothetical protein